MQTNNTMTAARTRAQSFSMAYARRRYADKQPEGHWFDRRTMKFFGCRLPRTCYMAADGSLLFVTSEASDPWMQPRRYSVRRMDVDGEMDTIGDFHSHECREDAMAVLRAELARIAAEQVTP